MAVKLQGKRQKTKREREDESQLRSLAQIFEKRGIAVRREKLARGTDYRVKSGDCIYSGRQHLFVDRRLPVEQQVSVLVDYLCELELGLNEGEVAVFSDKTRALLAAKGLFPTA